METKLLRKRELAEIRNLKEENKYLRNIVEWYNHKPNMLEAYSGIKNAKSRIQEIAEGLAEDEEDYLNGSDFYEDPDIDYNDYNDVYEDYYPYFTADEIPTWREICRREDREEEERKYWEIEEMRYEYENFIDSGLRAIYTALEVIQENIKNLECEKHKIIVDSLYHIIKNMDGENKEYIMEYFKYTFNYLTPIEELNKALDELLK